MICWILIRQTQQQSGPVLCIPLYKLTDNVTAAAPGPASLGQELRGFLVLPSRAFRKNGNVFFRNVAGD